MRFKHSALCQQAIAIDPGLAAAYALLSWVYIRLGATGLAPSTEVMPLARIAARKAVELDDSLAEGHISLSEIYAADWDFAGALREVQRGLELNRGSDQVYTTLAMVRLCNGNFEEALAAAKRATELGPSSLAANTAFCLALYSAGSFDRAIEQLNKTLELAPQNPVVLAFLADVYACAGESEKATEKCLQTLALAPGVTYIRGSVAATYAKIGNTPSGFSSNTASVHRPPGQNRYPNSPFPRNRTHASEKRAWLTTFPTTRPCAGFLPNRD